MDALEMIFSRRSVREFLATPVEKEKVETMLKAAMSAPSARDERPWEFIVIDDKNILNQIPKIHPYGKMCSQAAIAIICCANLDKVKDDAWFPQDLANASENLLLSARALDLGAVWLGVYPRQDRVENLKKFFSLPDNIIPFNIIPIGHTNVEQKPENRFDQTIIHYNKWS